MALKQQNCFAAAEISGNLRHFYRRNSGISPAVKLQKGYSTVRNRNLCIPEPNGWNVGETVVKGTL